MVPSTSRVRTVIEALKACKLLRQAQLYFASRKEQSHQIEESKTIEDREKCHEVHLVFYTSKFTLWGIGINQNCLYLSQSEILEIIPA